MKIILNILVLTIILNSILSQQLFQPINQTLLMEDIIIHEQCDWTECDREEIVVDGFMKKNVCKQGSVVVDPWLINSIQTQYALQRNKPLNEIVLLGSHNSEITAAFGYGAQEELYKKLLFFWPDEQFWIANQQFTVTDQLNMGVRQIEMDIHYFNGKIRICHAGGVVNEKVNNFIKSLSGLIHYQIDWDTQTLGCFFVSKPTLHERTVKTGLQEISHWLNKPENDNEVLLIMFDDSSNIYEWNKVQMLENSIGEVFGNLTFTPSDKSTLFPNSWPSLNQIRALGKRIIFAQGPYYGQQMFQYIFLKGDLWTEYVPRQVFQDLEDLNAQCNLGGRKKNKGEMIRIYSDSLIYSKFWNGISDGLYYPKTLLTSIECDISFPCVDQVNPQLLKEGAVWSWAENQPDWSLGQCVYMDKNSRRWYVGDCSEQKKVACQHQNDNYDWQLGQKIGLENDSNSIVLCPLNYQFATPTSGMENRNLYNNFINYPEDDIWINLNQETYTVMMSLMTGQQQTSTQTHKIVTE